MINSCRDNSVRRWRRGRASDCGADRRAFRPLQAPDNAVYKFPYLFIAVEVFGNLVILSITGARRSGSPRDVSVAAADVLFSPGGRQVGGPLNEPLSLTHSARPLLCISAPLCAATGSETNRWGGAPHCVGPAPRRIVGGLPMINDSKKLAAALQEVFIRRDVA